MLYSSFDKLGRFKAFTDVSCSRGWSCESIKKEILESVFGTFICQKTVEKDKLNLNMSLAKKLNRPGPCVDRRGRLVFTSDRVAVGVVVGVIRELMT